MKQEKIKSANKAFATLGKKHKTSKLKRIDDFPIAIHPGEILQEILVENKFSQTQLAKHLKMDVSKINEICKGRRGVSAEMAVLLAKALRVSAGTWMNLQKNWELSQVNSAIAKSIEPMRLQA